MKRKILTTVAFIGLAIILLYGVKWTRQFFQIDSCLDRGGRWNYKLNECEGCYDINKTNLTKFYWHTLFDSISNKDVLIKGKLVDSLGQSPNELIKILNKRESESQIEFLNLSKDTLTIKISNLGFVTEQIESTRTYSYLGETVFTITENESIKCLRIETYANLSVYKRDDFKDLLK